MWKPSFHHMINYLNLHKSTSEGEQSADGGLHHTINYSDSPAFRFEPYHLVWHQLPGEHIAGQQGAELKLLANFPPVFQNLELI